MAIEVVIAQASVSETLRALNELRNRVLDEDVFNDEVGICSNVRAFTGGKGNEVLRAVFAYLGLDRAEPIPCYTPRQRYGLLWQDDELYKRLYLIEACIAVLEGRLITHRHCVLGGVVVIDSRSFLDCYNEG